MNHTWFLFPTMWGANSEGQAKFWDQSWSPQVQVMDNCRKIGSVNHHDYRELDFVKPRLFLKMPENECTSMILMSEN